MQTVTRPREVKAGFHAEFDDSSSGLHHVGEQWAAPRYLITAHVHPVWEFYVQLHGATRWTAGEQRVTVRPGEVLGVPAGVRHHMAEPAGGNHHFFYAAVDVDAVTARRPSLAAVWRDRRAVVQLAAGLPLVDSFEQLAREVSSTGEFPSDGLDLAVDLLVLQLSRLLLDRRPVSLLDVHPSVAHVRALLEREYTRSWSLADLAATVGLAPTYLSGLFTAQVGCPPHTYLLQRRVDRAARLLESSDLPITAIGFDVGFGSSQHFSRVFRQLTGRSPREHRAASRRRLRTTR